MGRLASITVYPIKSLDGVSVESIPVVARGALEWDRRWLILSNAGEVIHAKHTAAIHSIRSKFNLEQRSVTLSRSGKDPETFALESQIDRVAEWLSDHFGYAVGLAENLEGGFPDDPDASGPTVVSTATYETVASWYPDLSVDEIRRRFRANLEVDGVEPFWEDRLYGATETNAFQIGDATFYGHHSSQRCVVVTRDSRTGEVLPTFAKQFIQNRKATLPKWAPAEQFDHCNRLVTNTTADESSIGKTISVGDAVEIAS